MEPSSFKLRLKHGGIDPARRRFVSCDLGGREVSEEGEGEGGGACSCPFSLDTRVLNGNENV